MEAVFIKDSSLETVFEGNKRHLNYKRSSANDFHETFALKRFHIENVVLKKSLIFLTSQAIRKILENSMFNITTPSFVRKT